MLQLKTVVIITAGVITVALGAAALYASLGPLLAAVAAGGLLLVARALVRREVLTGRAFGGRDAAGQDALVRWLTAAGVWRAAWIVALAALPESWWVWTVGLLAVSWLEYLVADMVGRRTARLGRTQKQAQAQVATTLGHDERAAAIRVLTRALERADFPYLQVREYRFLSAHQLRVTVVVPSRVAAQIMHDERSAAAAIAAGQAPSKQRLATFGEKSAEAVGIALSEVLRRRIDRGWVTITEGEGYGEWEITVMTRDVMADVIPYYDDPTPRSARSPIDLGLWANGEPMLLPRGHGQVIAKTGAGKTNLLYRLVLHYSSCALQVPLLTLDDAAVVWVGGRTKMYETWGSALLRYQGVDVDMPIDWIAAGQARTVDMLLAMLLVVEHRQAVPIEERGPMPWLVVIIDEYTDVAEDTSVKVCWRGKYWSAVDLDAKGSRVLTSAKVIMIRVVHRGVNSAMGSAGGQVKSAMDWTVVMRSNDLSEIGRSTGDYKAKPLKHPGQLYAAIDGAPPREGKMRYVQEIGKATAPQTDGTPVDEAFWARRDLVTTLEPGTAAAAGSVYAARHRRNTPAFREYLRHAETGSTPAEVPTGSTAAIGAPGAQSTYDRTRAEARATIDALLGKTSSPVIAAAPVSVAAPEQPRPTRADRVLEILADGPMPSADVRAALEARFGDEYSWEGSSIYNVLGQLAKAGRVAQQSDKRWRLVEATVAA
ncbi:MAG: hypothetical protein K0R87_1852 [Pseudonocardia sp.]|nr:hypothetical protein [Pseudonocardia sp.]